MQAPSFAGLTAFLCTLAALWRPVAARPLVPSAAALVLGVLVADVWRPAPGVWLLVGLAAAALGLARKQWLASVALPLLVAALAGSLHVSQLTPGPQDLSHLAGAQLWQVRVRVVDRVYQASHNSLFVCRALTVTPAEGHARTACGLVRVPVAGDARAVLPGQVLRLERVTVERPPEASNWFQPCRRTRWQRQGIHAVVRPGLWEVEPGPRSVRTRLVAASDSVRGALYRTLRVHMRGPQADRYAGLLASMVIGDQAAPVADDLRELFRRTGTVHLLVVSGAQVSILVAFLALPGRRRRLMWWQALLVTPLLLFFGLVAGSGPSINRALVMCGMWLVAQGAWRQYDLPSAMACAVIALGLANPAAVFDVGAQLTFAATLGVVLFLSFLPGRITWPRPLSWHWLVKGVHVAALGTAGAWALVTPLIAHYFYSVSLLGAVANVIAVPLSAGVVVLGMIAAALGWVWLPLAAIPALLAQGLAWVIVEVNSICARLPLAQVDCVYLSTLACVAWMAAVVVGVWALRSGWLRSQWERRRAGVVAVAACAVVCLAVPWAVRELSPRPWRVMCFDVGEGQCTLIETPHREAVLVDAGTRGTGLAGEQTAREVLLPYLARRGCRRLAAAIISHPDSDHWNALPALTRRVPAGVAVVNTRSGDQRYQDLLRELEHRGTPVKVAGAGDEVRVGALRIRFLWPPAAPTSSSSAADDNNASLVARAQAGGRILLLPGDLETAGMERLLAAVPRPMLRADLLQVPHHGRDSANLPGFFEAVAPRFAVVSRGGDPAVRAGAQTCARVARRLLSTEHVGAVMVEWGGGRMWLRTFRPQAAP